jgi:hypothetical protein
MRVIYLETRKIHLKEKVITDRMSCTITSWYGRFGNNIIQLSKALYYCETNEIRELSFPYHPMLKTTRIVLEHNKEVSNTVDIFYHTDCDASFDEVRSVSLKYLPYILNSQNIACKLNI